MSEQLRSLRHERDVREHGDAVTTKPWWNAPGEESRAEVRLEKAIYNLPAWKNYCDERIFTPSAES